MNPAFRQRCESALTHPVTAAALAVLLLNDVVLKALWPNPWTTGKLSDLAWVIFASPLLAFLLSLVTRGNLRAERAAFAAAYVGLPVLYAAFNTFEPVHDAILRALSLAGGSGPGSPLDPADSLVIPIGLAAAVWVWRREPAAPNSLRMRLGLLTAAVAALASVATSQYEPPDIARGITVVGINEDGMIMAADSYGFQRIIYLNIWISNDGGLQWDLTDQSMNETGDDPIVWGSQMTETPRGIYTIDGPNIVRYFNSKQEIVYSAAYLQQEANVVVEKQRLRQEEITTTPWNIAYDDVSGNVIAAMGVQGVVVGAPDGQWRRVTVGSYNPTDFSLIRKARTLLNAHFWVAVLALSLSFTAVALVLSKYRREDLTLGIVSSIAGLPALTLALALIAAALLFIMFTGTGILFGLLLPLVFAGAAWMWVNRSSEKEIAQYRREADGLTRYSHDRQTRILVRKGLILTISAWGVVASILLLPSYPDPVFPSELNTGFSWIAVILALVFATIAAVSCWPQKRHWIAVASTMAGMYLLTTLVFILWIQGAIMLYVAKASAVALLALATLALTRYLKRGQPQHPPDGPAMTTLCPCGCGGPVYH